MSDKIFRHLENLEYEKWEYILVPVDNDTKSDIIGEQLMVEFLEPRKYRVKCIPAYIEKLSYNDIITFPELDTNYSIEYGGYISVIIKLLDNDVAPLKKFTDKIAFEYLILPNWFAIAFLKSDADELQEMYDILMDNQKYEYYVKGVDHSGKIPILI